MGNSIKDNTNAEEFLLYIYNEGRDSGFILHNQAGEVVIFDSVHALMTYAIVVLGLNINNFEVIPFISENIVKNNYI